MLSEMIYQTTGVETDIRNCIGKHGMKKTFLAIQKIMKEDFEFLSEHFMSMPGHFHAKPFSQVAEKETSIGAKERQKEAPAIQKAKGSEEPKVQKPAELAKAIIRVKKVEEKEVPETKKPEIQVEEETEVKNIRIHEFLEGEEPRQADPSSAPGIPPMPPKGLTVKEIKQWQKGEEDKKRDELREKGIDPQTLLTKDNLKQWIEKENKSYAVVARYHVGLPEMYVSEVAKKFGVQSALAKKRRAQIMAARGGR
jgi:hypothetical protein